MQLPEPGFFTETKRFLLRPLRAEDAPGMFELDSDPEVHRYLGNQPIQALSESEAVIRMVQQQYADFGIGRWAVIDKATQDFIGWSGLKYEWNTRSQSRYYDLGYRIRRKYWGQGIASETARAALEFGFDRLSLSEICAAAHVENAASNKVLLNCGFSQQETFEYDGEPHFWYRLDRLDWAKKIVR